MGVGLSCTRHPGCSCTRLVADTHELVEGDLRVLEAREHKKSTSSAGQADASEGCLPRGGAAGPLLSAVGLGRSSRSRHARADAGRSAVTLHVYDLGTSGLSQAVNRVAWPLGLGVFHCGVEIYDWEWSYAATAEAPVPDTGVFCCQPRGCGGHTYCTSLPMGCSTKTEREVLACLHFLEKTWLGDQYDVLRRNCNHFCDEFCRMLGVQPVPTWVTRLAAAGRRCEVAGCCCAAGPGELADGTEIAAAPRVEARAWYSRDDDIVEPGQASL